MGFFAAESRSSFGLRVLFRGVARLLTLDINALELSGAERCTLPLTPHQAFLGNTIVLPLALLAAVLVLPVLSANCSAVVYRSCCLWLSRRCIRRPRYVQPVGDESKSVQLVPYSSPTRPRLVRNPTDHNLAVELQEALHPHEPAPEQDEPAAEQEESLWPGRDSVPVPVSAAISNVKEEKKASPFHVATREGGSRHTRRWDVTKRAVVELGLFMYMGVTMHAFTALSRLEFVDGCYAALDLAVRCDSSEHRVAEIVAAATLLLFSVSLPLAIFTLRAAQDGHFTCWPTRFLCGCSYKKQSVIERRAASAWAEVRRRRWSAVFGLFRTEHAGWYGWLLLRRLLIGGFYAFRQKVEDLLGGDWRLACAVVLACSAVLQASCRPYIREEDNVLEATSLAVLLLLVYLDTAAAASGWEGSTSEGVVFAAAIALFLAVAVAGDYFLVLSTDARLPRWGRALRCLLYATCRRCGDCVIGRRDGAAATIATIRLHPEPLQEFAELERLTVEAGQQSTALNGRLAVSDRLEFRLTPGDHLCR
jgi:hypothetical protein